MIEDMKMLISDMDRKVDLLMEKIPDDDAASASSKSKKSNKVIFFRSYSCFFNANLTQEP